MSILQVNVRPAAGFRQSVNSQRGGEPGHAYLTQRTKYPKGQSTNTHHQDQNDPLPPASAVTPTHPGEQSGPSVPFRADLRADLRADQGYPSLLGSSQPDKPHLANPHTTERYDGLQFSSTKVNYPLPRVSQPNGVVRVPDGRVNNLASTPVWQNIVWRLMPGTTVGRALNAARERLDEAGCSTASLDAQVILAYVLGVNRSWLFAHHEYKLNSTQADTFTDLTARRMRHEPVAYLVGHKEFYGLDFFVDHRVLIPRPETELLVDAVLDFVSVTEPEHVTIADVGTGSGAIALSVANHCVQARIYAIDLSPDALEVAERNIARLDIRRQVTLGHGDLLTSLPERVNIIVANLPYISSDIYCELDVDVRDFEPQLALEAGPEGLDAIEHLLQQVDNYLLPNGAVFLEIGHDQGEAVSRLAQRFFPDAQRVSIRQDYHGRDRLVTIVP